MKFWVARNENKNCRLTSIIQTKIFHAQDGICLVWHSIGQGNHKKSVYKDWKWPVRSLINIDPTKHPGRDKLDMVYNFLEFCNN